MDTHTGLDATFLKVEDADPHANFAVGALAVMEGPLPGSDSLSDVLTERLSTDRRFSQVVRRYPLDIAAPHLVAVGEDISHHVHHIAVPRPGDDQALFGLVSDVMSWRLHHDHPLWECWVVEGLSDDRWAILLKTHSSVVDGTEVMQTLTRLSDNGGADGPTQSSTELPTLTLNPLKWVGGMWRSSAALTVGVVRTMADTAGITRGRECPAVSKCSGQLTGLRRYASVELSLEDVTKVCDAFGVTINDIALAAMGRSYRDFLIGHGRRPHCDSLRALVSNSTGSIAAIPLPVENPDPVQQLRTAHGRLTVTDERGVSATNHLPFALKAQPIRALPGLPQRGVVALTTAESRPRGRLRFMGRDVVRLLPIPAVGLGLRTGLAMVSYAETLTIGVISDHDALPDIGELANSVEQTVARLLAVSTSARRTTGKRMLYLIPSEAASSSPQDRRHNLATTF
ncbi:MAG: WS/DGAT domain-containing protein [Actinomycetota bacterium]|nr:WS/DGAT domain-containing protein [Actinomycetota bacterium]